VITTRWHQINWKIEGANNNKEVVVDWKGGEEEVVAKTQQGKAPKGGLQHCTSKRSQLGESRTPKLARETVPRRRHLSKRNVQRVGPLDNKRTRDIRRPHLSKRNFQESASLNIKRKIDPKEVTPQYQSEQEIRSKIQTKKGFGGMRMSECERGRGLLL
jgi:hypothetical protein